ncbi:MAG: hypothetical protein GY757_13945, partial [bacterium]|nr:hypothetical protein [bacterium]
MVQKQNNEQKNIFEKKKDIEQLYRRLVEFTGDAVYVYTYTEGEIVFANKGFVKVLDLDCPPEEIMGKKLKDIL